MCAVTQGQGFSPYLAKRVIRASRLSWVSLRPGNKAPTVNTRNSVVCQRFIWPGPPAVLCISSLLWLLHILMDDYGWNILVTVVHHSCMSQLFWPKTKKKKIGESRRQRLKETNSKPSTLLSLSWSVYLLFFLLFSLLFLFSSNKKYRLFLGSTRIY